MMAWLMDAEGKVIKASSSLKQVNETDMKCGHRFFN